MTKKTKEIEPTFKQANKLILVGQKITLQSKRLIYFMARHIDEQSGNPGIAIASWDDFLEFMQLRQPKNWGGRKNILKNIRKNLNENPVQLETKKDGKRKFTVVNWIQSLELNEDTNVIELVFADKLIPFLIYLKDQSYTRTIYEIENFRSMYTVRLKEIIETKRWKEQGYFDLSLKDLKFFLGVEDKYSRFRDFRIKVLDVAQKELAAKNSPVQFSYATIRHGGRVVKRGVQAIRFFPKFTDVQTVEASEEAMIAAISAENKAQYPDVYKQLRKWNIAEALIAGYIQNSKITAIRQAIAFVKGKKNVKIPARLFIKAMLNGWKPDEVQKGEEA